MSSAAPIRRIAKWAGLCFCALILAAWGLSLRWILISSIYPAAHAADGVLQITWGRKAFTIPGPLERSPGSSLGFERPSLNHFFEPARLGCGLVSRPGEWVVVSPPRTITWVRIPFWLLFAVIALPTVALFRFDRRRFAPGHCQRCSYNLTGNTSSICSECGEKVPVDCKTHEPADNPRPV